MSSDLISLSLSLINLPSEAMDNKGIPDYFRDAVAVLTSAKVTVRFYFGLMEREAHSDHYDEVAFGFEIGLVIDEYPSSEPLMWMWSL